MSENKLYVPPHRRIPLGDMTNTAHRRFLSDSNSIGPSGTEGTENRKSLVREDTSPVYSLAADTQRFRQSALTFPNRAGPGPSKARRDTPPSYTLIAAHHLGLGERVLDSDLDPKDLECHEGEKIEKVEYVGSYKWVESEDGRPTIAVPGVPDIWDPPNTLGQLELDKFIPDYQEFPDYAAALLPDNLSTLEPTFLCLTTPSTLADADIVTGRNSLRKLWAALDPDYSDHVQPFRIDLVLVGGLLMLDRFEPSDSRVRHEPTGYHLSYHETTTRPVLEGSDRTPGCIRVIKYSFGGLKMMVKFDVAAFLPDEDLTVQADPSVSGDSLVNDEDLDGVSTNMDMDGLDFDDPVHNGQSIAVLHTRLDPPTQDKLITIKTKVHHHTCDLGYYFPQMYFAQISRLHYARHSNGDFSKHPVEVYNVLAESYLEVHRATIDKMAAMLRWLVGVAEEHGGEGKALGLVWDGRRFSVAIRTEGAELSAPVIEMIKDARAQQHGER